MGGLSTLGGGLFGGGNTATQATIDADSVACAFVNKDTFWRQNFDIQKEIGRIDYDALKHNYELYIALDNKISALAVKDAQLEASLPLAMQLAAVQAERYADNKAQAVEKNLVDSTFFLQREIDKKIDGTMFLPWSSLCSMIPTMPACSLDVTCGSSSAS